MTEERTPYGDDRNNLTVRDDGDLRKYFTMIPNIVMDSDLDVYAKFLYVYLKRVAGEKGACWQGTRKLAEACKMSVGKIAEAKTALVSHGFIEIEKGNRTKTDVIVMVNLWEKNIDYYRPPDKQGVHTVNTGVHQVNVIRSLEEEPMEKTNTSTLSKKTPQHLSLDQEVDFTMGKKTSKDPEWDAVKDKVWDETPGAVSTLPPPDPSQPTLGLSSVEETNAFASQYRQLDGAPDVVRRVSFLLHQNTGFIPAGTKPSWIQQINLLWEAARHSEKILIDGLQKGEDARRKDGLTYSGPRGYVNFVRNEAAVPVKTVARRSNSNPSRHGQTVHQVGGRTVVTMT